MVCRSTRSFFPAMFLVAALGFLPRGGSAQQIDGARIDDVFAELDVAGSPGCAVGVVRSGDLVYSRGYGFANLDYGIPIGAETVFDVGSVTKSFTAAAVLLAQQQGLLSLDDDIRRWLPEFPEYQRPVTVDQLVHHTSGVRDHLQLMAVGELPDDITPDDLLALLARQRALNFPPGDRFLYSNAGYFLLAEIIERASGRTLGEYMEQELFVPLGMEHTHLHEVAGEIVPGRATGYGQTPQGFVERNAWVRVIVGGGALRTTVADMARWAAAFQADRLPGNGLARAVLRRGATTWGDSLPYAVGLTREDDRGVEIAYHGGATTGFRAGLVHALSAGLSVFTMCNLDRVDALGRALSVMDILLEDRLGPPPAPIAAEPSGAGAPTPSPVRPRLTEEELRQYEGLYYSPELDRAFPIEVEDGALILDTGSRRRRHLPASKDFFDDGRAWSYLRFQRDADGRVTGFTMDIGRVNGLIFERMEPVR